MELQEKFKSVLINFEIDLEKEKDDVIVSANQCVQIAEEECMKFLMWYTGCGVTAANDMLMAYKQKPEENGK